jgi:GntR family transcriptional regulator
MKFKRISMRPQKLAPLYSRIESIIRNKIFSGQFEPGEKLPREEDLALEYNVSKITVRNALSRLEAEGLIVRTPGKGTFIAENIPVQKQFIVTGGIHDIVLDAKRYEVKPLGIETIKVREARITSIIRNFFNFLNNDEITIVRRIRLLKGTPIYFLENFIPKDIAKHLSIKELSQKPLLSILKEKAGFVVGRGEMYIEAIPADADVAEILNAQIFEPIILMQVFYWFPSGDPFEVVNAFMRSDYFKYKVDLHAEGFEKI